MTNLYPRDSKLAWVGLSRPTPRMLAPGVALEESESRFEITVPLASESGEVDIELTGGMIVVSTKDSSAPSEDLDDVFAPERTAPLMHYVMVGPDIDPHSISALHVGDTLVISARKRRLV